MGWLSWERFRCNIDCKDDPDNCISENLFMDMADRMSADGYSAAGYQYITIDDCWLAKERDLQGRLQPDPERFPGGIRKLADYVSGALPLCVRLTHSVDRLYECDTIHARGMKLGIYEDFGTKTCAGYPGSEYHLQADADTFAEWGVDLLKLDGCYSIPSQYDDAYPEMGKWLNRTGRPILYSCSWPAYQEPATKPNYTRVSLECNAARNHNDVQDSWTSVSAIIGYYGDNQGYFNEHARPGYFNDPDMPNYPRIATYCNIWRNYGDIQDSWASLKSVITFYGQDTHRFIEVAAPGSFNDPDMLIIGNFGLSYDQQRVQMALWCIMAAPLMMSTDLRNIRQESRDLLLNKGAIAINQDRRGIQGRRIHKMGNIEIWTKPVYPKGDLAFAILNLSDGGMPSKVTLTLADLGVSNATTYKLTEVFDDSVIGVIPVDESFKLIVNPTGVVFYRVTAD